MKRKFFIETYGCQMNVHDSEYMATILQKIGYEETENIKEADIIIVNTCAVRQKAEEKAYSFLGRLKPLKKRYPQLIIGICGCVAQKEGKKFFQKIPFVDLVFGTHQIYRLSEFIGRIKENKEKVCEINFTDQIEPPCDLVPVPRDGFGRAYITIMQGCNNFCTYCIVPYVRGRVISRPSEKILQEAKFLVEQGIKEIILLGQNVNAYGQDRADEMSFTELLYSLANITGLKRLRFITSHPKDLSPELIRAFGELEILCEQIHLPVQAGSDRILKKMGRKYTRSDYLKKIEALRKTCPEIAITTDIIVGFPGETEKDFKETLSLLQEVEFDGIFAFKYSDRPPAKGVLFPEKLDEKIKAERLEAVLALQAPITEAKNKEKEGKVVEVLLDGYSKKDLRVLSGRSRCYRVVNVEAPSDLLGHIVEVKIEKALAHSLKGKVIRVID